MRTRLQDYVGEDTLHWGSQPVPLTKIPAHAPGWTVLDRLYFHKGTMYIVSDYPKLVPKPVHITSKGRRIQEGNVNIPDLEPTEEDLRVISTREAYDLFGQQAIRIGGVTFLVNESPQFMTHMYHFVAELLFGLWRTYSSLDPDLEVNGHTRLAAPKRICFTHLDAAHWRDYAAMNQYVLRAVFPSAILEFSDTWEERASLKNKTFVLDRVVFSDRVAAMHSEVFVKTDRIASVAYQLKSNFGWWNTIRMPVLEYSKVRINDVAPPVPVITYISRQGWGRRMLREHDHMRLVVGLYKLRDRLGYEVNIVELDRLSRAEQVRLAARTTIMMGVHGNGLTSLLWMKPSRRATVIEFFYPKGFAMDYQWTAEALGIKHYGVWDKETFTSPNVPPRAYPEGFQGNDIPVDAPTVLDLIERRLSPDELDMIP